MVGRGRGIPLLRLVRVVAGAVLLVAMAVPASGIRLVKPALANVNTGWTMYHYDNAHDGNDAGEPAMTTLQGSPILSAGLDENVQAEPLVFSGLVFAATENNTIYALNESSATLALVWKRNLAPQVAYSPYPAPFFCEGSHLGNSGVGITGTPVIDPVAKVLYAVALTPDIAQPSGMKYQLFRVRILDGSLLGPPVDLTFPDIDPRSAGERSALSFANGNVYVAFGGRAGDCQPYHPVVVSVPASGGTPTEWDGQNPAFGPPCSTIANNCQEAGIWSSGGMAIDGSGNVFLATGNGPGGWNCALGWDHGDAVIKLSPTLQELDHFAPSNWCTMHHTDQDMGSIGPVLLSNNTLFQTAKTGQGWILSTTNLGNTTNGSLGTHIPGCATGDAAFGSSAWDGTKVYVPCDGYGVVALNADTVNKTFTEAWVTPGGYSPGPPIVAGGYVWATNQGGGTLHRINPADGTETTFAMGSAARFNTPAADSGRIFVAQNSPSAIRELNFATVTPPSPPLPAVRAALPAMSNQAYGGYTTSALIQNVGGAPARVVVLYFDQSGFAVGSGDINASLPVNATWTVRQDSGSSFSAGGAGSALIYSDQPLAAFVNESAPGGGDGSAYSAVQLPGSAGTSLFAPAIANGAYGGYTTGIGLINLSSGPTNLAVTYRDSSGTVVKTQAVNSLASNAYAGLYSGDAALGLPAGFAGTATIVSSAGPAAAIVNETGQGGQFSSYDAISAGSANLYSPVALNNSNGGYYTGMGIQNTTGAAGTVTINYYDAAGVPTTTTHPIPANGYLGVYQGTDIPTAGAYTAKLTSTVAIATIVNEVAPSATSSRQSSAFNTFASGSATLHLPLVENAGSDGWSTGEGIMNAGTTAATVTVTYYDVATGIQVGSPQSNLLQPNAFWGLYQPTGGLPAGSRATAVVTTAGQVAVICNESSTSTFMSYLGE